MLTSVSAVRALPLSESSRGQVVRVRGIVTLEPQWDFALGVQGSAGERLFSFCISENGSGIRVVADATLWKELRRGELVEVSGVTREWDFAPDIRARGIVSEGMVELPRPQPAFYEDLASGRFIWESVQVRGIVRRVAQIPAKEPEAEFKWRFEISTGGGRFVVLMRGQDARPPEVDSEVEVEGIASALRSANRRILRPRLIVPENLPVRVLSKPPEHPPERRIGELLAFRPDNSNLHRVSVRGVVTFSGGGGLWIQHGEEGLQIISRQPFDFELGDEIEAVGFADRENFSVALRDVAARKVGGRKPVEPKELGRLSEALNADAQLVSLKGELIGVSETEQGITLRMQEGEAEFAVTLKNGGGGTSWIKHLGRGAFLKVSGICMLSSFAPPGTKDLVSEAAQGPEFFVGTIVPRRVSLMARSGADIEVLSAPSWWTSQRVAWGLGGACGFLLLGLMVVWVLSRRRLRRSEAERAQAESEFRLIWNERNRIAREIHDTLAQDLGVLSIQLELIRDHVPADSPAGQGIEEARKVIKSSIREARNSIWQMRSHILEQSSLAGSLRETLERATAKSGIRGRFELRGEERALSPLVEGHFLRVGQEAIANAVKHANAQNIEVSLVFGPQETSLIITDDGRGFVPSSVPDSTNHFGLCGLRERAAEIEAELRIESGVDRGTKVVLSLNP